MGVSRSCIFRHGTTHLILSLMLFMGSTLTPERFTAEGRNIPNLVESAQEKVTGEEKMVVMRRSQIGSSPPRCERRCSSCTNCEAIQVPVTYKTQNHRSNHSAVSFSLGIAYSRDDSISNYKPMSWKCKCGNLIFNP